MGIDDLYTVMGCPKFIDDPSYLGHIINDGAKATSDSRSHDLYYKISLSKANSMFYDVKGLHVAILATKNIPEGEEVLITYGLGYWINRT